MKTIVICGSMKAREEMLNQEAILINKGFNVFLPNMNETNDYSVMAESDIGEFKNKMIVSHLNKIKSCDAILVVNTKMKEIDDYIGANSFLEIGFAFCLGKKIFLLNGIPDQPNCDEICGMLPIPLHGDLNNIIF